MATLAVNATAFSRGLSEFLTQVLYTGQVPDIERGKPVVARVSPVSVMDGLPIGPLEGWLDKGPQLGCVNRVAMVQDVRAVRAQLRSRADPWAS